jgi:hypothetical protein
MAGMTPEVIPVGIAVCPQALCLAKLEEIVSPSVFERLIH